MGFQLFLPGILLLVLSWILAIIEANRSSNKPSERKPELYSNNKESNLSNRNPSGQKQNLYSNHDESIEDRWDRKAQNYLESIESDLTLLLGEELSDADIINAAKVKNHILSQYDSYWKWTEKCAADCESQTAKSRLWDSAREDMKFKLSSDSFDAGITTWWGVPSNKSVREQLEKRLNDRIAELRPEAIRKKKLMKDMVAAVAAEETMLRADLMKMPFNAVSEREVSSVYRILVRTGRLFEMKTGNRYIVFLSDKERAKKERMQRKAAPEIADATLYNPEENTHSGQTVDTGKPQAVPCGSSNPTISESPQSCPASDPVVVANDFLETLEELKESADDLLTRFFANYFSVVLTDYSFSDADNIPSLVSQCLLYYDSYHRLNLYDRCGVDPLEYMKLFIGDRYEPCMDSREELEKHLESFVSQLETVKKRKENLDSEIILYLSEKGEVPISDVLEHQFGGCTLKEVEYCYGSLKKSSRILEFKVGEVSCVRLSRAETEEVDENSAPNVGMESSQRREDSFSKADLIAFLDSKNMEYVDKTPSGGCFWILGGPNTDSVIQELVVDGSKPIYAKAAKALNHRPGWFIKPAQSKVNQTSYAKS